MTRRLKATTRKPSASMRARISPAFFEATALGLMMANVFSMRPRSIRGRRRLAGCESRLNLIDSGLFRGHCPMQRGSSGSWCPRRMARNGGPMNPSRLRPLLHLRSFLALAVIGGLFAAARPADAASPTITFHLVADTATAIPDGAGSFTTFFSPTDLAHPPSPCISFGTGAFFAAGVGQQGIYMIPPGPPGLPAAPLVK